MLGALMGVRDSGKAANEADFAAFVAARYAALVRTAVLLGCPQSDAEDAVQDVLASCFRSWHRVARADSPDAYAHRVLVNRLARRAGRRWRGELPHASPPEVAAAADHAGEVAVAETVRAALGRLGRDQRAVVVLRYFADLTEAQTADALGVAVGTVKSRASRALAQLAQDPALSTAPSPAGKETP